MAKALILGSTGLIGSLLLEKILADDYFDEVFIWLRRPTELKHEKLKAEVIDFNKLPSIKADIIFSCLGTTLKNTPDPAEYRYIEVGIPVNTAKNILNNRLKQFHYISSLGASPGGSSTYLKNKGDAEKQLESLGIPSLYIYRPSIISGDRKESRFMEKLFGSFMNFIKPILQGSIKKYRTIKAETIAEAMLQNAKNAHIGTYILESDKIQALGEV